MIWNSSFLLLMCDRYDVCLNQIGILKSRKFKRTRRHVVLNNFFNNHHEKSTNHAFIYSIMVGRNKYYNFEWSSVICYRRWRILIRDSNSSRPLFLMKLPLVLYAFLFGIMLSPFRTRFFVRLYIYFKYFSSSLRAVQCSVQTKIWPILCASFPMYL